MHDFALMYVTMRECAWGTLDRHYNQTSTR